MMWEVLRHRSAQGAMEAEKQLGRAPGLSEVQKKVMLAILSKARRASRPGEKHWGRHPLKDLSKACWPWTEQERASGAEGQHGAWERSLTAQQACAQEAAAPASTSYMGIYEAWWKPRWSARRWQQAAGRKCSSEEGRLERTTAIGRKTSTQGRELSRKWHLNLQWTRQASEFQRRNLWISSGNGTGGGWKGHLTGREPCRKGFGVKWASPSAGALCLPVLPRGDHRSENWLQVWGLRLGATDV